MPNYLENPTIITLKVEILPEARLMFADWQAQFNSSIVLFPGFVSLEFLSPSEFEKSWLIVQRFSNSETVTDWLCSKNYRQMLVDLQDLTVAQGVQLLESKESTLCEGVTEVFITRVSKEKEKAYGVWSAKIHRLEAKFPGFRGVYVQPPSSTQEGHWITLLQFDTKENLDRWLNSPERQNLLEESSALTTSLETHRIISPYVGWFGSIAKVREVPSVWKQTMIVLLVLFPIVMLEIKFLSPLIASLQLPLATFIGNAISVTLIAFPMAPFAIWMLGWWLSPGYRKQKQKTILGTGIVILLYLLELFFFWSFI